MQKTQPKIGQTGGFTLIELLVVISIIMLLTIVAVANFSYVQQRARLDFAADTLVSSLREAQVLAKSGRRVAVGEGEPVLQCQAVKIVTGAGLGNGLYTGQSAYVGLPKDVTLGSQVDTCEMVKDEQWAKAEIFDGRSVILGDGSVQIFYFKPPFAQIYAVEGASLVKTKSQKVEFIVDSSTNPASLEELKKVEFDLATGAVKRL